MMKFLSTLDVYPMRHWKLQEGMKLQGTTPSRPVLVFLFAQADQPD
jgi:hypothetical protein